MRVFRNPRRYGETYILRDALFVGETPEASISAYYIAKFIKKEPFFLDPIWLGVPQRKFRVRDLTELTERTVSGREDVYYGEADMADVFDAWHPGCRHLGKWTRLHV